MDVAHGFRPAQIEQVVVAAHFPIPGVETGATESLLVEFERLDHGAHGAIKHEDALLHRVDELGTGACGGYCHENSNQAA